MQKPIIHGDVSFHPTEKLPPNLKKVDQKSGAYVVAHGETGHKHMLADVDGVDIYLDPATNLHVLQFHKPTTITHEEHRTLTFVPGIYIEKREQEYNPFRKQLQQVQD